MPNEYEMIKRCLEEEIYRLDVELPLEIFMIFVHYKWSTNFADQLGAMEVGWDYAISPAVTDRDTPRRMLYRGMHYITFLPGIDSGSCTIAIYEVDRVKAQRNSDGNLERRVINLTVDDGILI